MLHKFKIISQQMWLCLWFRNFRLGLNCRFMSMCWVKINQNKKVKVCEVLLVRPRKVFCDMFQWHCTLNLRRRTRSNLQTFLYSLILRLIFRIWKIKHSGRMRPMYIIVLYCNAGLIRTCSTRTNMWSINQNKTWSKN